MQPWKVSAGLTAAIAGSAFLIGSSRLDYLPPCCGTILAEHASLCRPTSHTSWPDSPTSVAASISQNGQYAEARETPASKTRSAGTTTVSGSSRRYRRRRRTRNPSTARRAAHASVQALLEAWQGKAESLRHYGGDNLAIVIERCADELEATLRERDNTTLNLTEAARESGYSREHLGRLVRDGKIPNAGRPGAPRIARRHLPRKHQHPGPPDPRLAREQSRGEVSARQIVESIIEGGID